MLRLLKLLGLSQKPEPAPTPKDEQAAKVAAEIAALRRIGKNQILEPSSPSHRTPTFNNREPAKAPKRGQSGAFAEFDYLNQIGDWRTHMVNDWECDGTYLIVAGRDGEDLTYRMDRVVQWRMVI